MGKWFVEPVYQLRPSSEKVIQFRGLNRKPMIDDGEMRDMKNLSSDEYPCLVQRHARGKVVLNDGEESIYHDPQQMIVKYDRIAVMDKQGGYGYSLYYDNQYIDSWQEPQTMIGMNNMIVLFPAKVYFDAKAFLEADEGDDPVIVPLEAYVTAKTVAVESEDYNTKLTFPSGTDLSSFKAEDTITMYGTLTVGSNNYEYSEEYPIGALVNSIEGNVMYLEPDVFLELNESGTTTGSIADIEVMRLCPDLACVMEHGNRLWGASDDDNTIRCSKLADPTNWEYYQGESLDSYAATQGTEGAWTGCAAYSTHLLFFKENYIHKVYGSYPAQFQIAVQEANGVELGSMKSIVIIEDFVFYKSRIGIMCYSGDRPELVSGTFAANTYRNAVAGANRRKYYVSMQNTNDAYEMLVFDTALNVWHREDFTKAECFCFWDEQLLFADDQGNVWAVDGGDTKDEKQLTWFAELGPFTEYLEDKKVISKIKARYVLEPGARVETFLKTDNNDYEMVGEFDDELESHGMIRIIPQRCDKYWVRFEGRGRCRIESIVRQYRAANGQY